MKAQRYLVCEEYTENRVYVLCISESQCEKDSSEFLEVGEGYLCLSKEGTD